MEYLWVLPLFGILFLNPGFVLADCNKDQNPGIVSADCSKDHNAGAVSADCTKDQTQNTENVIQWIIRNIKMKKILNRIYFMCCKWVYLCEL